MFVFSGIFTSVVICISGVSAGFLLIDSLPLFTWTSMSSCVSPPAGGSDALWRGLYVDRAAWWRLRFLVTAQLSYAKLTVRPSPVVGVPPPPPPLSGAPPQCPLGGFSRWQTDAQIRVSLLVLRDVVPREAEPRQAAAGRHRPPDCGDRSQSEPAVPHGECSLELNVSGAGAGCPNNRKTTTRASLEPHGSLAGDGGV